MTRIIELMWRRWREFNAGQVELNERLQLLNRPWEMQFLHWSGTGDDAVLHGHVPPPAGRRLGVTRGGWCACPSRREDIPAR